MRQKSGALCPRAANRMHDLEDVDYRKRHLSVITNTGKVYKFEQVESNFDLK